MSVLKRRDLPQTEVDSEGSWAISYGDMITLLLSFFILFFSTDKVKDHQNELQRSLITKLSAASHLETPPPSVAANENDPSLMEILKARVHKSGQKIIVEFPEVSFFKLGDTKLTSEGRTELSKFLNIYQAYAGSYYLNILAYTDNKKVMPLKGRKFSDNLELSALRSVSTMRTLQKMGVPLNRMKLGGYGEMKMTATDLNRAIASTPNYETDGLKLSRKVVLVIEPDTKESL